LEYFIRFSYRSI